LTAYAYDAREEIVSAEFDWSVEKPTVVRLSVSDVMSNAPGTCRRLCYAYGVAPGSTKITVRSGGLSAWGFLSVGSEGAGPPIIRELRNLYYAHGKVVDGAGKSLAQVNVYISGTDRGTLTDENGQYHLTVGFRGAATLRASLIGYPSQEKTVEITGPTEVNFQLSF
jgi:hypothetical protein